MGLTLPHHFPSPPFVPLLHLSGAKMSYVIAWGNQSLYDLTGKWKREQIQCVRPSWPNRPEDGWPSDKGGELGTKGRPNYGGLNPTCAYAMVTCGLQSPTRIPLLTMERSVGLRRRFDGCEDKTQKIRDETGNNPRLVPFFLSIRLLLPF